MKRKCYVAGPMRGIEAFNFPAFEAATAALRALGWHVFSPAEFDQTFGYTDENRGYIRRDLHVIVNELHDGYAIIMLPGWQKSVGANAERDVAEWCKLDRYDLAEAIERGTKLSESYATRPADELEATS